MKASKTNAMFCKIVYINQRFVKWDTWFFTNFIDAIDVISTPLPIMLSIAKGRCMIYKEDKHIGAIRMYYSRLSAATNLV